MKDYEAWNNFALSGSVFDYLKFKEAQQEQREKQENEDKNRRTDFKTTEYR
ncbi:MAG: hypothetical protein Q4D44_02770 [Eubacteriales bacterium]|nr:hypothetical protein [Eubacteriales bacterium]